VAQVKQFDAYIEGLNPLLRDLQKLGKEAGKELRQSSRVIADRHMVPAFQNAARSVGGDWGDLLAADIRSGLDRLPKVSIGKQKKVTSGGASSNMLRYPTDTGNARQSYAPFEQTNWIAKARTYQKPALEEWGQAVDRLVRKWPVM
jgi:hypothetical protein